MPVAQEHLSSYVSLYHCMSLQCKLKEDANILPRLGQVTFSQNKEATAELAPLTNVQSKGEPAEPVLTHNLA